MPMQLITPEGTFTQRRPRNTEERSRRLGMLSTAAGFFTARSNLKRLLKQRNAALRG